MNNYKDALNHYEVQKRRDYETHIRCMLRLKNVLV